MIRATYTERAAKLFCDKQTARLIARKILQGRYRTVSMNKDENLVEYFRSPEGFLAFGCEGDRMEWTPEQTAIRAMEKLRLFPAAAFETLEQIKKQRNSDSLVCFATIEQIEQLEDALRKLK